MQYENAIDRCIEDLSSTLELVEALERQLEQARASVGHTPRRGEAGEDAGR